MINYTNMIKMSVLWIDSRDIRCFEGQLIDSSGKKYYFNYSVSVGHYLPMRGQSCMVAFDGTGQVGFVRFN